MSIFSYHQAAKGATIKEAIRKKAGGASNWIKRAKKRLLHREMNRRVLFRHGRGMPRRSLFRLCTIPEFPNSDRSETTDEHFNGRIIEINCGWPPFVSRLFVAGSPISWLRIFPCRLVDRVFPRREHQPVWMDALHQLLLCIPRVYTCRGRLVSLVY